MLTFVRVKCNCLSYNHFSVSCDVSVYACLVMSACMFAVGHFKFPSKGGTQQSVMRETRKDFKGGAQERFSAF